MDPRLQEVIDHHAIRKLMAEYAHGCDRADAERMASVYAEQSWDDHGPNKCDGREFARLMTGDIARNRTVCSHMLGQSLITIAGDTAGVETYFIATVRGRPGDVGDVVHQLGGRYVDTLERSGDGWLVKSRVCVREWSISQPVMADWLAGAGFVESRLGPDDPAYAALGIRHNGLPSE
ncbi:MAG: nuclear transport factor 2 family protein [Sphingomonadales bacterium]|nr:nuclear transport factor 2 family protein [Sphingomonadales bacterium]